MLNFSGYQITEALYESANSVVYRGRRQADGQSVVLKLLQGDYPPPEKIAWFRREYDVTHKLDLAGVVTAYSLESDHNRWAIILEDFGAESLARLKLAGQMTWPDFLKLAIDVTDILGQLHQQHIMHKDINPSNLVYNPTTGQVKIIDFGISTVLSRENPTFRNPNVLEGTLAYISPEQTGRMNRAVDYRSDFYSLGVTFYELLTGQLPFPTQDPLALVHSHLAQQPAPPHEIVPNLPRPLSEIVLKLMAKNAEDRYQSAYGLKMDLEACLQQWEAAEQMESFPLGQHDVRDRFQTPQKLYGREQEIEILLNAFERVSQGASEMMLVAGYAGIGKSALVQEVYKPITRRRGYFITGKFDQLRREVPYSAFIQAFRSLIQQLLTETEAEIAVWRERLLAALGSNGQVIIEVIPEVELIIGAQPELADLSPTEAQNRFNLVFQNFIKVFTQAEHPLTIFLDDLQWTDGASLKLIQLLMTAVDSHYLFLIGAYRDNEVNVAHPLLLTLAEIKKADMIVNEIFLTPLDLADVTRFTADALNCGLEIATPLAELVLTKTGGNPFFINEFLKSLYSQALLTFDMPHGTWQWDLAQIQARQMTNNVIDLMAGKVQQLPQATQQVLKLAACIGSQFELQTLAIVYEKSIRDTAVDLWAAIAEGLILPLDDTYKLIDQEIEGLAEEVIVAYKFAHDRIQQAVYSLIAEEDKQVTHRWVGKLLLHNTVPDKREERIFDIVNQLNAGLDLVEDQMERDQLAELNLEAGQKAKDSAAFQSALNYLMVGVGLLDPPQPAQTNEEGGTMASPTNGRDSWQRQYDLTLNLHVEAAEMSGLSGDYEQMERLTDRVFGQAKTLLDKIKVYEVLMRAHYSRGNFKESLTTGLQVLKLLGVIFPEQPSMADMPASMQAVHAALAGRQPKDLVDLPEMSDPEKLAAIRIMNNLLGVVWKISNELWPLIVCQQMTMLLTQGNTAEAPFVYVDYAVLLCLTGDYDQAYQFGKLALTLLERFDAPELRAKTYMMVTFFIRHWKEPLRETLPLMLEGYQSGAEAGDLEYASYCASDYCQLLYTAGYDLIEVDQQMARFSQAVTQLRQQAVINWHRIYWQAILNLIGRSQDPCRLVGEVYDEEKMLPLHREANDNGSLLHLYVWKVRLFYWFQEFQQAYEDLARVEQYLAVGEGTALMPSTHLVISLVRLAMFSKVSKQEQEELLEKVKAGQDRMKLWAEHAPMNYLHKYYLVEAERAKILENDTEAREYYDKAIELAQENGYLNEESLAYELAARFYLDRGQIRLARYYMRDAHYAYQRWGAIAKVKDLEARYPQLLTLTTPSSAAAGTTSTTSTTGQRTSSTLDLASVLKASQAISGKIELGKLLETLITIVIENAGAQRGLLLLEKKGRWFIEAEGSIKQQTEAETEVIALQSIPLEAGERLSAAIVNYVARTKESVVLNDALHEGIFTQDPYIVHNKPKSILCTPLINQGKLTGILYLENNLATGAFTPNRVEILNLLSTQAAISIENASLFSHQVQLTNAASRFVPHEFLHFLNKDSLVEVKLGDHIQQEMAVLFSDIRSFTALSETMTPQENFDFVNAYFGYVSPVIRQYHGIIVKYLGDGMMAVFPKQIENALDAAIEKQKQVTRYNAERQKRGECPIQIGIGIHVGKMMLGTVGEAERMQNDFLSDVVNLTARLEGLTKTYGASIVISQEVLNGLEDPTLYSFRFLDKVLVKGRQEPVSVFEVFDGNPAEIITINLQTKSDFEHGLMCYYDRQFVEAKAYLEQVLQQHPEDKAAQLYLERAAYFVEHGAPDNWTGVEAFTTK